MIFPVCGRTEQKRDKSRENWSLAGHLVSDERGAGGCFPLRIVALVPLEYLEAIMNKRRTTEKRMTEKEKPSDEAVASGSFDLAQLRELIEMMEQHDVTEVNLRHGDQQWRLRRGPSVVSVPAQYSAPIMPAGVPAAAPAGPAASAPGPAAAPSPAAAADSGLTEIKSPAVGTFYAAPTPDDPPFVKVGSKVSPETTVCLIEAMKVFNQIPADCSGIIEKILAKDGDAIEFGQPLFLVRPA